MFSASRYRFKECREFCLAHLATTHGEFAVTNAAEAADIPTEAPVTSLPAPLPASELQALGPITLQPTGQNLSVPLNQRVLNYIELFQGRLHDFIDDGMRRGSKYLPMIQNIFKTQGLPPDLAYVPLIESAFQPEAISRASAKGVWQFMLSARM